MSWSCKFKFNFVTFLSGITLLGYIGHANASSETPPDCQSVRSQTVISQETLGFGHQVYNVKEGDGAKYIPDTHPIRFFCRDESSGMESPPTDLDINCKSESSWYSETSGFGCYPCKVPQDGSWPPGIYIQCEGDTGKGDMFIRKMGCYGSTMNLSTCMETPSWV